MARKIFLLFLILSGMNITVHAQFVSIPDPEFRNWLSFNGYSSCLWNNTLDSTCAMVQNTTSLTFDSLLIADLQGLHAFANLETLIVKKNLPASLHVGDLPPNLWFVSFNDCKNLTIDTLPSTIGFLEIDSNNTVILPSTFPSSLQKLKYAFNYGGSLPAAFPPQLTELNIWSNPNLTAIGTIPASVYLFTCSHNAITSLPPLPPNILQLTVTGNRLTTLPALPGHLETIFCDDNLITSLPAFPNSLKSINCSGNLLTSLPNFPPGFQSIECNNNQLTSFPPFNDSLVVCVCMYNMLTYIPDIPNSMQLLYCGYNPDLKCLPYLNNLTDVDFGNTGVLCLPSTSSLPNLQSFPVCDLFNINGCSFYWSSTGNVYQDLNADCNQASNESALKNIKMLLLKNGNVIQQTFTRADGNYAFDADTSGIYQTKIDTTGLPFNVVCPSTLLYTDTISPGDTAAFNKFAIECNGSFDLTVSSIVSDLFGPARVTNVRIHAGDALARFGATCSLSHVPATLTVNLQGSPVLYYGSTGTLTPTLNGTILTYQIPDISLINPDSAFIIQLVTDTFAVMNSEVCMDATISTPTGDLNPLNNSFSICFFVRTSFDPNDKQVYPNGNIDTTQQDLIYTIRFQNTGNAPADNIYLLDTIDSDLDLTSIELLATSHDCLIQIYDNRIVRLNFPNINLPDSNTNESQSHGYVQYRIKLNPHLPMNTEILNTAHIFFDFNPAVVTNTTLNTISSSIGVNDLYSENHFSVYPNPFDNEIYLRSDKYYTGKYSLFDIIGNEIHAGKITSSQNKINLNNLTRGIYIIKITSDHGSFSKRIIKL